MEYEIIEAIIVESFDDYDVQVFVFDSRNFHGDFPFITTPLLSQR